MPRRKDIHKILVIGSGPIQIGQACEFDYSGTQALKALKQEGFETVLVNSNPATIMTDPEFSTVTYMEPLTLECLTRIIEKERPDALLPTVGGQTALNLAMELHHAGVLEKFGVRLIGANAEAIHKAEDRKAFKECMAAIGLLVPKSVLAHSMDEARNAIQEIGFPCVIRPAFTLGGSGGSIAENAFDFEKYAEYGLSLSPIRQILVEESVLGWKEFELEVMRDSSDNVVIICSIENMDPMGIHTGDSITVAPAQTLTDKEFQQMRDSAIAAIRAIGVDTGGCNIQFAVNPRTGKQVLIEINPRVSRSSALASKATGFPIAKIAAKLAVGYTLDELPNDITKKTPASFEPSIDYVVTKIPRFSFEKFPATPNLLTTQMKSVGEVMAIGRTFKESLLKAMRSLESQTYGFESPRGNLSKLDVKKGLKLPKAERLWFIGQGFRQGMSVEEIYRKTKIDPWFLRHVQEIVSLESEIASQKDLRSLGALKLRRYKKIGFSDKRISVLMGTTEENVRQFRKEHHITPVYKSVDTCAAEFEAHTPYMYSTYESEEECPPTPNKKKALILGSGPNRIGQGIEFDYCCVHASMALKEAGFETIMVNCNPETVSTDYDISDRLYFEPLTLEDVLHIIDKEKPTGVVVQFGGQTPLKLAASLAQAGVPILGTSAENIDRAEDRKKFKNLLNALKLKQPASELAHSREEARTIAKKIGYPFLLRPSYVLGGRAMVVVYSEMELDEAIDRGFEVSDGKPLLLDHYLQGAIELDVDALCDGKEVAIAGILEHIEEAGIHSGDSSCCIPPHTIPQKIIAAVEEQTKKLCLALEVKGLMNVQFAILEDEIFVLEANPRASRTVPFVSKATGIAWAKLAARVLAGDKIKNLVIKKKPKTHVAVKSPLFPFIKFPGVDPICSPEMCSIGEVMGEGENFAAAFAKAQLAVGQKLPKSPARIFLSIHDGDKSKIGNLAKSLVRFGFELVATKGTHLFLNKQGIPSALINKLQEGSPHIVEALLNGKIQMVFNTSKEKQQIADSYLIRRTALERGIPYFTNIHAAKAAVEAICYLHEGGLLEPIPL